VLNSDDTEFDTKTSSNAAHNGNKKHSHLTKRGIYSLYFSEYKQTKTESSRNVGEHRIGLFEQTKMPADFYLHSTGTEGRQQVDSIGKSHVDRKIKIFATAN
jgi:hypothetical protein